MKNNYDLTIIGAGPAGMAAAITARIYGLNVLVIDEQFQAGGQIYRNIENLKFKRKSDFLKFGAEYISGYDLVNEFNECGADFLKGHSVWDINSNLEIFYMSINTKNSLSSIVKTKQLLIAVGAIERPMPIPGWTLPGVMGCGAINILYKSSGIVPDEKVILAGSGPLLLLTACRLLDEGVKVSAILNTNHKFALLRVIPCFLKIIFSFGYFKKMVTMFLKIFRAGVPIFSSVKSLEALGSSRFEKVSFTKGKKSIEISAGMLLIHHGMVPNVQITRNLKCEHSWFDTQRYWEPVSDDWGNTSLDCVSIAGDCGRVSGAKVSELKGRIASLNIAYKLGAITEDERNNHSLVFRKELKKKLALSHFIDKLYRPNMSLLIPENGKTLICRCEEVSADDIRLAVRMGAESPDRIKSFVRCGMGLCQSRMCGLSVSEIIGHERKISPAEVGYFRIRSPIKPITLDKVAS